jgi:5-methylthioadenosine/S-adenosylhomocysteine deaminase
MEELNGPLEPGKKADFILVDLDRPHLYPQIKTHPGNIPTLLVCSARGSDVDTVVVDGVIVLEDNIPISLDPVKITKDAQASFEKIQQRIDSSYSPLI